MSTNGVISVVNKENKVLLKIVTGCDGYNIAKTVAHLYEIIDNFEEIHDLEWLFKEILDTGFGCENCLVVMDHNGNYKVNDDESLEYLYMETFDNPAFNPRWEKGTAEYCLVVHLNY